MKDVLVEVEFTKYSDAFYYALSRSMYSGNYCWVCEQHFSRHKKDCAWVAYHHELIERKIRGVENKEDEGPDFTLDDLEWNETYE